MAEVAGMQSLAELRQQLLGYQEQLKEIQAQLRVDPSNAELIGARDGLQASLYGAARPCVGLMHDSCTGMGR